MLPMFRIRNRTLSGKLIGLLSVLASALPVALAGDRSVTTTRRADFSRRQHEIDIRQHVVDAVGVMLNAARVHDHGSLRPPVE